MSGLAEDEVGQSAALTWAKRIGAALVVLTLVIGVAYLVKGLGSGVSKPKRQVAKIQILPDTPPPPPPKPKDEPKPEPKEQKETQVEQPKPQELPQEAQQLKMEGAAGEGPSAFAAGAVANEYKGGDIGTGNGGSGLGKAAFAAYRSELQARIQARLVQLPALKKRDFGSPATVKLDDQRRVVDVALNGTSGDAEIDRLLLDELKKILARNPPPSNTPYADFTVRVTNKMLN